MASAAPCLNDRNGGAKLPVSGGVKIKRGDWVEDPCRIEPAIVLPVPAVDF